MFANSPQQLHHEDSEAWPGASEVAGVSAHASPAACGGQQQSGARGVHPTSCGL